MPNTRKRDVWEPIVWRIVADHPKWGQNKIAEAVKQISVNDGVSPDYPSARTLHRIKNDIAPEDLIEYKSFSWPESMERGELPWEASAAALELLRFCLDCNYERPSNRLVRWFWRVTQAAPGLCLSSTADFVDQPTGTEPPGRYAIACRLATGNTAGIGDYLAYLR